MCDYNHDIVENFKRDLNNINLNDEGKIFIRECYENNQIQELI